MGAIASKSFKNLPSGTEEAFHDDESGISLKAYSWSPLHRSVVVTIDTEFEVVGPNGGHVRTGYKRVGLPFSRVEITGERKSATQLGWDISSVIVTPSEAYSHERTRVFHYDGPKEYGPLFGESAEYTTAIYTTAQIAIAVLCNMSRDYNRMTRNVAREIALELPAPVEAYKIYPVKQELAFDSSTDHSNASGITFTFGK